MSYQQKRILATLFTSLVVFLAYCQRAWEKFQSGILGNQNLGEWANLMLTYIVIGIAVTIITQIVFHIVYSIFIAVRSKVSDQSTSEKEIENRISNEFIEDERDKLIELRSTQVGFALAGIGFVAGLILMNFQGSAVLMLNVMFLSLYGGSLVEAVVQLFLHRVS